jgi:hypothetical protein
MIYSTAVFTAVGGDNVPYFLHGVRMELSFSGRAREGYKV